MKDFPYAIRNRYCALLLCKMCDIITHIVVSSQYCRISKNLKMGLLSPFDIKDKSSLQMCCIRTVCFKIRVATFKFCCNSLISQPLPKWKTHVSQKTGNWYLRQYCTEPTIFHSILFITFLQKEFVLIICEISQIIH